MQATEHALPPGFRDAPRVNTTLKPHFEDAHPGWQFDDNGCPTRTTVPPSGPFRAICIGQADEDAGLHDLRRRGQFTLNSQRRCRPLVSP